jgi:hypothetical protein
MLKASMWSCLGMVFGACQGSSWWTLRIGFKRTKKTLATTSSPSCKASLEDMRSGFFPARVPFVFWWFFLPLKLRRNLQCLSSEQLRDEDTA